MRRRQSETYRHEIASRRWRQLRRDQLTAHPLCQECERQGRITAAVEVHHRQPVETGATPSEQRRLMYDVTNLMSVCRSCHVAIHSSLGKNTKQDNKERNEARVKAFINKLFN